MDRSSTIDQKAAFEKLSRLKVGALFMAMGTGKTKVALDLMAYKAEKVDYFLWICPCSLKREIESERLTWRPELSIDVVGCESIGSSDRIYLEVLEKVRAGKTFIVVDESLKIKNRRAKRTERIINLGRLSEYRLILNGTPISRNYCDLWAQMEFLSPLILKMTYSQFFNTYCEYYQRGKMKGRIKSFVNIPHLIDKISPYIFDAELDITTKKRYHTVNYCTDPEQYNEYKYRLFDECYDFQKDDINFYIFSTKLQRFFVENSTRDERLADLLDRIDGRCLVYVKYLSSIPDGAVSITGEMNEAERARVIEDFRGGKVRVLYVTYGCGAYGLNLQCCQNMVFAEHTWDYAVREQAEARIYRMGQKSEVNYYDLVCANSGLEKLIQRCLTRKTYMLETVKNEIQKLKGGVKEWVKTI